MRRLIFALTALALPLSFTAPPDTQAGAHYPDLCLESVLCRGLVEHFDFEEGSDDARFGAFGTQLNEPPATNIPNAVGKLGSAVSFDGTTTSFLWKSFAPGPSGYWTIAFWFKPAAIGANGTKRSIISWDAAATGSNGNDRGPDVYLESNGTSLRLCVTAQALETDAVASACESSYAISTGAWYFGAVGSSKYHDGNARLFVSRNAGTVVYSSIAFYTRPGSIGHVRLGLRPYNGAGSSALSGVTLDTGDQPYQGLLDSLDVFSRTLSPIEITLLYASGSGRAYPYVTD